jgi:hypothetical protein
VTTTPMSSFDDRHVTIVGHFRNHPSKAGMSLSEEMQAFAVEATDAESLLRLFKEDLITSAEPSVRATVHRASPRGW